LQIWTREELMENRRAGGCRCGEVRFQLTGEPNSIWVCHCPNCQSATGSIGIITVAVADEGLEITQGTPETKPLGPSITNYWCGSCITHLYSNRTEWPGLNYVMGGLFDDTSWIRPCAHIFTRNAQPWIVIPTDVPTYATQPDQSELLGLWGSPVRE
jgi:hypothetical protein